MRVIGVIALVAACGGPVVIPPAPPPLRPTPKPVVVPAAPVGTALSGRVVLDGEPVRYYGVTVMKNFASAVWDEPAKVIRSKDGRFRVVVAEPGAWDLVIAGPGFARRVVSGNTVEANQTRDIGDVVVTHGHTLRGVVRDLGGAPVADADVALVATSSVPQGGALDELARGNLSAVSADDGSYEIDDIGSVPLRFLHASVSATTHDHRMSLPSPVHDGDATVDLAVGPVGTLEVRVTGTVQGKVFVRAVGSQRGIVQGRQTNGVYRVEAPVGDYDVVVFAPGHGPSPAPQLVTLTAGTVASLTVASSSLPPVAVKVHVANMTCDEVMLSLPNDDSPVVTARCSGSDADLMAVEPGMYVACATGTAKPACGPIRVLSTGAQRFEIEAKKP